MTAAADRYTAFVSGGVGAALATRFGLPRPEILRRYDAGAPFLTGDALILGEGPGATSAREVISRNGATVTDAAHGELGALILDATAASSTGDLRPLYTGARDTVKQLAACARVLVIGLDPTQLSDVRHRATQQGLTGFVRSLARELRGGATANLIQLVGDPNPGDTLDNTIQFLLSARSAYVDGQPVKVGPGTGAPLPEDPAKPLQGKVAVVTGAARGIGAEIARTLARQGAKLIAADLPVLGHQLAEGANTLGGLAVQVDVTSPEAAKRIADAGERFGGIDIVVHNAGIIRDRMLVNMEPARWDSVLAVNLEAQLTLDETLLAKGGPVHDEGRIISVASIAGIAGNRGQANYATSKAGVIGMVAAQADRLADRRITYNAVAPGMIETEMTAAIPMAMREISRRLNALSQGGQPVDVAETIAFLAEPRSGGISGQTVRVCGFSLVGA